MAAKRQEAKKLVDDLNALAEELATAKKPWPLRDARRAAASRGTGRNAWAIGFKDGLVGGEYNDNPYFVRAVRGGL